MAHVRKQVITFYLTTKCNLKCVYCYTYRNIAIKKEHQVLNLSFAKKGIDDFFRDYSSRHIRFYGIGEPTLEFDLMKQIADYARQKSEGELTIELQTNGIFSDKVAQWIAENVDILWVSCDGPPEIQNLQRPTCGEGESSKVVEKSLKYLNSIENIQVGVRSTLTVPMIKKQRELVKYFAGLGIKYVNVHPACNPVEEKGSKEQFEWDPIEFAENFLDAHNEAKKQGIFYNCLYIANFDEKTRHACRSCIPYPQLTTDGYVACCDYGQFGPEYSPGVFQQLIYGKYIPEEDIIIYDEDKISKIRSRCVENLIKGPCHDCEYIHYCAGGCLGETINETGDIMGLHKKNCIVTKYLAKRMPLGKQLFPSIHS